MFHIPSGKFRDNTLNQTRLDSFHIGFNSLFDIVYSFDGIHSEVLTSLKEIAIQMRKRKLLHCCTYLWTVGKR
jgi:hypothetical protein